LTEISAFREHRGINKSVKDYNCSLCRMKRICDALEAMMQFQQQEQEDSIQYLGGFVEGDSVLL
jgi:hypothetical protein